MKNRGRQDINAMILELQWARKIRPRSCIKRTFLTINFAHLTELQDNGLLEYRLGEQTYVTTNKGEEVLEIYNTMNELTTIKEEDTAV